MTEDTQTMEVETVAEAQEAQNQIEEVKEESPTLLRTPNDGCFEIYDGPWGKYIRPCIDPDANAEITKDHLKHFELKPGIHKIPADLWSRWVRLAFHFVDKVKSSVEVSIRILRSEEDSSKYRILVPKQKVSGATVRVDSFEESIDIETGEELTSYPPQGWIPVGSSHSHNTMAAFFSGTDDKYELGDPGIHLVVGSIKPKDRSYTIAASVVGGGRRFELDYSELIDATPIEDATFHPKVLDYVDYTSPLATSYMPGSASIVTWTGRNTTIYNKDSSNNYRGYEQWLRQYANDGYNDPHFYSENSYYYNQGSYSATNKEVKLWEVEDIINDYLNQHTDNVQKLLALESTLKGALNDVEAGIQLNIETLI